MDHVPSTNSTANAASRARFAIVCSAVWLATMVAGLAFLWKYENAPAPRMAAPATWPSESEISRTPGAATLVMFAHPKCPCTRASVGELAEMLAKEPGSVRTYILFYKPDGSSDEWAHTDLWRSAAAIPGVKVACDEDGAEAARFGASTSGSVVLYDAAGHLEYNGGITGERGHWGDNEGQSAIAAILAGQTPRVSTMPVLGCSILTPGSKCQVPGTQKFL
jgi:hypothetical protein